jgi:hypothetical protein
LITVLCRAVYAIVVDLGSFATLGRYNQRQISFAMFQNLPHRCLTRDVSHPLDAYITSCELSGHESLKMHFYRSSDDNE